MPDAPSSRHDASAPLVAPPRPGRGGPTEDDNGRSTALPVIDAQDSSASSALSTLESDTEKSPATAEAAAPSTHAAMARAAEEDATEAPATPTAADAYDDSIYGDQDDVQSLMQPSISPIATRLSSHKTPAAERAMAMASLEGVTGAVAGAPVSGTVDAATAARSDAAGLGYLDSFLPSYPRLAKPAAAAATVTSTPRRTLTMRAAVFNAATRNSRSSSVGTDALKRLSKALPSLSFPKGTSTFFPSLPTSSFFSSVGSSLSPSSSTFPLSTSSQKTLSVPRADSQPEPSPSSRPVPSYARQSSLLPSADARRHPPPATSRPSYLRRSTSDDSLLYHSLSRVSSLGDGDNFDHVREQVNSRVKAIMDSFPDRPSFKLPSMPSFFPDAKAAGTASREPISPLDSAIENMIGDVVVLGGYRGSILRSAERPHRQLWVPVKVGLNIRKVNLEVGLDDEDEEKMEESIFASGMLQHIGPVDISRRLFRKLRESDNVRRGKLRVHDFGYDWRLSPHRLSQRLIAFLEKLHCNTAVPPGSPQRGALVIAHSLGGLITRHAVNQRPDLFSGVIFAGTPQRCINVLGPLRNGDAVLLNEKVLTAAVNFSLRTTFAFLPEDGFCFVNASNPAEEYRVDFYNTADWIRYRLSPCVGKPALRPILRPPGRIVSTGDADGSSDSATDLSATPTAPTHAPTPPLSPRSPTKPVAAQTDNVKLPPSPVHASFPVPSAPPTSSTAPAAPAAPAAAGCSPQQARSLAYLERTLAQTKRFRAELVHRPELTNANAYPPLAVVYGKGIPTVYAARVTSRAAIACSDAYDDLVFRSGDGVVLTREAMLPEGYHAVRDGYVSTDRGHVSILGDHAAIGRAIDAVIRGRKKGIGLGLGSDGEIGDGSLPPTSPIEAASASFYARQSSEARKEAAGM